MRMHEGAARCWAPSAAAPGRARALHRRTLGGRCMAGANSGGTWSSNEDDFYHGEACASAASASSMDGLPAASGPARPRQPQEMSVRGPVQAAIHC